MNLLLFLKKIIVLASSLRKNNVTWYFDIYQDVVLAFDGINEQVELKTIEELENYLTTC